MTSIDFDHQVEKWKLTYIPTVGAQASDRKPRISFHSSEADAVTTRDFFAMGRYEQTPSGGIFDHVERKYICSMCAKRHTPLPLSRCVCPCGQVVQI